jgi:hypothetical protein
MTDFGADRSFEEATRKVQEHYGIAVAASGVRVVTQKHGLLMQEESEIAVRRPRSGVTQMIAESDGCLVPIVKFRSAEGDKRKQREVLWREAKLCMARPVSSVQNRYAATLGGAEELGLQWRKIAIEAGLGENTLLHCLGDGAKWIVSQVAAQFGTAANYLLDFYHLSEYLADASEAIAANKSREWLHIQQERLKQNNVKEVLLELSTHKEAEEVDEQSAPVRACERYLKERLKFLDYKSAIEKGLPIGSGEIESGNRSVVQARLKISGAWWTETNARKMLALRTCRANQEWKSYWNRLRQANA